MTAGESGDWRSDAVLEALSRYLEAAPTGGDVLVLADPDPRTARLFERVREPGDPEPRVTRWSRVVTPGAVVAPWPPAGPWSTAALRLPRAKDELAMSVHAAASILEPGGVLLVYGAKDEGIRSASDRIEPLFGEVDTVAVKSRCRVLRARRPVELEGLRGALDDWRETWRLTWDGLDREWVSYPGVFSHGRLDAGTRLLLDVVAPAGDGSRILDYGCGSGVIAGVLGQRANGLRPTLLDADAVALEAARENVPGARLILADGLHALDGVYGRIVSNPPYHRRKAEDRRVLETLVRQAPDHLERSGALELVVQRRFPVGELLSEAFHRVQILTEDATYRVWRGERPRSAARS